jgi:hypothetical protein
MPRRNASSLRAALSAHTPGRGKPYPAALKVRIAEYVRSERSSGTTWAQLTSELGVSGESLRLWCSKVAPEVPRALVPVTVVADREEQTITVVSASGHRMEGLTLRDAVTVLRALG